MYFYNVIFIKEKSETTHKNQAIKKKRLNFRKNLVKG